MTFEKYSNCLQQSTWENNKNIIRFSFNDLTNTSLSVLNFIEEDTHRIDKMSGIDRTVLRLNNAIMAVSNVPLDRNPKLHIGINPLIITMRKELDYLQDLTLEARRKKLRKRLIEEFLNEEKELRSIGLAYINTIQ